MLLKKRRERGGGNESEKGGVQKTLQKGIWSGMSIGGEGEKGRKKLKVLPLMANLGRTKVFDSGGIIMEDGSNNWEKEGKSHSIGQLL